MTPSAWIFLAAAWGTVAACTFYCFYKLMTSKRAFGEHNDEA